MEKATVSGDGKHALFSYGTLQQAEVQLAVFGRTVAGEPDALTGFGKVPILIDGEPYVTLHPAPDSLVRGVVLEVTEAELAAADEYEGTADYRRIKVTLASGCEAFVYVGTASGP